MAGEQQATISVEWIDTTETPFRPDATTQIFAELEPLEADQASFFTPTYTSFFNSSILPPAISFGKLPDFEAPKRELIINLETTSTVPWEGRIITIGVLDPNALEPKAINFIQESEEATIDEFLAFWQQSPYTTLVAYNVAFDYRFIYAVLQKYRKESKKWLQADLYDLMQQQKQVKNKFVPGFNKPGTLEQWSTYLFGSQPYAPQKQLFKWYEQGNIEEIINFNNDKLAKAYGLWVLNKVVEGSIPGAEILARPGTEGQSSPESTNPSNPGHSEETIPVVCKECLQDQTMLKTDKVVNCRVCGTPIAHP
ncbi:hypothetical protein LCGC14_1172120 [marine sediment metagenome]|uniref:YprB ribonuclease H-like domain-containing protein n=1 Tax=marine sediment metagenome TaxID=412755 RepID=A0A0F9LUF8_9ZZZZ